MAETIKNNDFVELDYTGMLKEGNLVFDTSSEAVARKEGLYDQKMTYGTVSICVGQGQILKGLDANLEGLEVGKEHEITLPPEQAFGKKDGKLMKLVPTSIFKKQGINPVVGLQVNIDGAIGTLRTVTGGRTVVDFNHPFANKEIVYKVNLKRLITDEKEKVLALVELALNQKKSALTVEIKERKATIEVKQEFPDELLNLVKERITNVLPNIKDVEFKTEKKEAPKEAKPEPEKQAPEAPKPAETAEKPQ
ncbi:FKBP-type peptidyl-prolyl cis-trans isomerase [Nanoarchaeota archaeon]